MDEKIEILIESGDVPAIQAAVDRLAARSGGGTVRLAPGAYLLNDAIQLQSNVTLLGSGCDTILRKPPSRSTHLVEDSDGFQSHVVVESADGIEPGSGVVIDGKCPRYGRRIFNYHRVIGRDGNRLTLDRRLGESYWIEGGFKLHTVHPMIHGRRVNNAKVRDLLIEGNSQTNVKLFGEADGAVSFIESSHVQVRNVAVHDFNGSAFSWQTTEDFDIRECASLNCTELGLHPGGGAPRSIIENNRVEGGVCGVFLCWGVSNSVVRGNVLIGNEYGISLGHRDTDNCIESNRMERSTVVGMRFRESANPSRNAHRNRIVANSFMDCGPADFPLAVDLQSKVHSIVFERNKFHESRNSTFSIGMKVGENVRELSLQDNSFDGFAVDVQYARSEDRDVQPGLTT